MSKGNVKKKISDKKDAQHTLKEKRKIKKEKKRIKKNKSDTLE
jgi:hypothetical protein